MKSKKNIIIFGAGVAGLNAARILNGLGFEVTIFEAAQSIGGRAKSFVDSKFGDTIDNGQHILINAYSEFLDFIDINSIADKLLIQNSLKTDFISNSKVFTLDTGKMIGNLGYLYGFIDFKLLGFRDKLRIAEFYLKLKFRLIKANQSSVYELLKYHNQSDELINLFWAPLVISAMNTNISEASAQIFINIMKLGFFKDKNAAGLIIPRVPYSTFYNMINNMNINYNHRVTNINLEHNKVISISIDGREYFADYYISAVPPYILKTLISNINFNYLNHFEYSPIVSAYLWFPNEIIEQPFANIVNGNFDWIFDKSKIDIKHSQFSNSIYSFTKSCADDFMNLSNNSILEKISEDLRTHFNYYEKPLHYRIFKEKFATIKSTPESDLIRPKSETEFGNLFLAGEWTDTGFPSTLEGAAISGRNAAEAILKLF